MPDIQDVKYVITAINSKGTYSLEKHFIDGNAKTMMNAVPSAILNFSDKNRTLSNVPDGLIPPTESFWVEVSASTDSGANWERLFVGQAEEYNQSLDVDSTRQISLALYEAPELRYNYVTPNQIAIGNCDFGQLFTGTNTASDGTTWSADSMGNYPNGLLYDTNLSFSSPPDFFAGVPDAPFRTEYNNYKKIDAIKEWMGNYGLDFWIDTRLGKFYIQNQPSVQTYPNSGYVVQVGNTVNKYNKTTDLSGFNSCVTLVGTDNTVFDTFGMGAKQIMVMDSDIISYRSARNQTKRYYSSSMFLPDNYTSIIPPTTKQLLGKSIIFREIDGDSETLSTVAVTHNFGQRWETQLQYNNPSYSEAKTIIEIQDDLAKITQSDLAGQVFVRVLSGASDFFTNEGWSDGGIVAIGLGSTPDTDSNGNPNTDSGIETPIAIKPMMGMISDSSDGQNYTSAYTSFGPGEANGLIRQVVLFSRYGSGNELFTLSDAMSWSTRPTTEWNSGNSASAWINIGSSSGVYLSSIQNVVAESTWGAYAFPKTARQLNVRCMNTITTDPVPAEPTSTYDGTEDTSYLWTSYASVPSAEQLDNMSTDLRKDSYTFSVASFSNVTSGAARTGSSGKQVSLIFECDIPVEPISEAIKYFGRLQYGFHGWASYSHNDASGYTPLRLFYFDNSRVYGDRWVGLGTISNQGSCSWTNGTLTAGQVITNSLSPFDVITLNNHCLVDTTSGKVRMALMVQTLSAYPDATLSMYIQYAGMMEDVLIQSGIGGNTSQSYIKKCSIADTGYISIPKDVHLTGIYAFASESSGSWIKNSESLNLLPPPQYRKNNDIARIWEPVRKKSLLRDFVGLFDWGGYYRTKLHDSNLTDYNEYYPYKPIYTNAEDTDAISSYQEIMQNRYVFLEYTVTSTDANVPPPPDLDNNLISVSYSNRGKDATFYIDQTKAPPYGCNIRINYTAVGLNDWDVTDSSGLIYAGTIGKTSFCLNTRSSIREGIDKNAFKTLNIQYDWYGDIPQSSGWPADDNAVYTAEEIADLKNEEYVNVYLQHHHNILMQKPWPFKYQ
jgi:hypothetical protein